jgi:hypothetical protein
VADPTPGVPFVFARGLGLDGVTQWRAGFVVLNDKTVDQIVVDNPCGRVFLNLHFRANGVTRHMGVPKNSRIVFDRDQIEQAFGGPFRWDDPDVRYGVTS